MKTQNSFSQELDPAGQAEDLCRQAEALYKKGNKAEAIAGFEAAINADRHCEEAYIGASRIFLEDGFFLHAMDCYARGIQEAPESIILKEKFVFLLRSTSFRIFNPRLKQLILTCLETPDVDFFATGPAWFSILASDPVFKPLYKALRRHKKFLKFKKEMTNRQDLQGLLDPFFLGGLKKLLVPDLGFERFLTHLRRFLLETLLDDPETFEKKNWRPLALALALAQYCFFTEYVFTVDEEERQRAETLKQTVESEAADESSLAVAACYFPLFTLKNARDLSGRSFTRDLQDVIDIQIRGPLDQQTMAGSIQAMTPIGNAVSQAVKAQYEEFPYPRWKTFSRQIYSEDIEGRLSGKPVSILVAGCGTGREAIELAAMFPQAKVLAIDLSVSSLSYAMEKNQRYGLSNIQFRQADILMLAGLPDRYDFIASSGVLHHMEDPYKGWSVLAGLLKEGGLMRVALYSDLARKAIAETRDVISRLGYDAGADSIRKFRADCKKYLRRHTYKGITASFDFYALSECRDLLFHVQEHRFDIPTVKKNLESLHLRFLGFLLPDTVNAQFKKMDPKADLLDLDAWNLFERKEPETFRTMYKFWCEKI